MQKLLIYQQQDDVAATLDMYSEWMKSDTHYKPCGDQKAKENRLTKRETKESLETTKNKQLTIRCH